MSATPATTLMPTIFPESHTGPTAEGKAQAGRATAQSRRSLLESELKRTALLRAAQDEESTEVRSGVLVSSAKSFGHLVHSVAAASPITRPFSSNPTTLGGS